MVSVRCTHPTPLRDRASRLTRACPTSATSENPAATSRALPCALIGPALCRHTIAHVFNATLIPIPCPVPRCRCKSTVAVPSTFLHAPLARTCGYGPSRAGPALLAEAAAVALAPPARPCRGRSQQLLLRIVRSTRLRRRRRWSWRAQRRPRLRCRALRVLAGRAGRNTDTRPHRCKLAISAASATC